MAASTGGNAFGDRVVTMLRSVPVSGKPVSGPENTSSRGAMFQLRRKGPAEVDRLLEPIFGNRLGVAEEIGATRLFCLGVAVHAKDLSGACALRL